MSQVDYINAQRQAHIDALDANLPSGQQLTMEEVRDGVSSADGIIFDTMVESATVAPLQAATAINVNNDRVLTPEDGSAFLLTDDC